MAEEDTLYQGRKCEFIGDSGKTFIVNEPFSVDIAGNKITNGVHHLEKGETLYTWSIDRMGRVVLTVGGSISPIAVNHEVLRVHCKERPKE